MVKQGLELQLCVLECLLLAAYDPQISRKGGFLLQSFEFRGILFFWKDDRISSKERCFLEKACLERLGSVSFFDFCRRDPEQICRIAEALALG